jgi:hypothetical protein
VPRRLLEQARGVDPSYKGAEIMSSMAARPNPVDTTRKTLEAQGRELLNAACRYFEEARTEIEAGGVTPISQAIRELGEHASAEGERLLALAKGRWQTS